MSGAGDQFPETTIRHAFDLWFNPEIIRRGEAGLLPATFVLFAAQVVIDPEDTAPVVRLNEEVRGAFKARPARQVAKGEVVRLLDIKELEGHSLGDDDPNAGHLTVVRLRKTWYLFFDFRYNTGRITNLRALAEQFRESARSALQQQHMNAFIENLFAATESMAKAFLMMTPDRHILKSKKHNFVATHFNLEGKHQRANADSVKLLNKLAKLRGPARYGTGLFRLDPIEAGQMYEQALRMERELDAIRPKRDVPA